MECSKGIKFIMNSNHDCMKENNGYKDSTEQIGKWYKWKFSATRWDVAKGEIFMQTLKGHAICEQILLINLSDLISLCASVFHFSLYHRLKSQ